MRLLLVAALALIPTGALAQFAPYGVTTYPGLGQTPSFGYGAAPGAGIGYGYNGPVGAYGTQPGYGGTAYGYGNGGGDPYGGNAVGSAYAVPGSANGEIRNPDDVMNLGRTRGETGPGGALGRAAAPVIPPAVGALPLPAEKPDPKGQRFEGVARVIDGNTLALAGEVIVLDGADAPELGQTCTDRSGLEWRCGDRARARLVTLAEGRRLVCTGRSAAGSSVLATCLWGTTDLGRAMVSDGWAMAPKAVSTLYLADEAAARADARGIWAGTAQAPWTYRNAH